MPTLLPHSPFSTQAATMAKTWQNGQEPTAGEHPLVGWGDTQGSRQRPPAQPQPQTPGVLQCRDTEHREPLPCQKPLQQIRKMEH